GAINFVFSSIVDLLIAPKHNTVTVTAEIVAMIVNDNAFFFILCMIDDVNTTSVIDTLPFFERFNVLNISETELRKNKYAPKNVKNKMINDELLTILRYLLNINF